MISTKKIGTAVMVAMAILGAFSQGLIHLPLGIPETWTPIIQSWSATIISLYAIVNLYLPADIFGPLKPLPNEKVLTQDTLVVAPAGTTVTKNDNK